jgi:hypothetical protein
MFKIGKIDTGMKRIALYIIVALAVAATIYNIIEIKREDSKPKKVEMYYDGRRLVTPPLVSKKSFTGDMNNCRLCKIHSIK